MNHLTDTTRRLASRTFAQKVEAIKHSPSDLRRLAHASGWKVLTAFAVKMDAVNSHNEWQMSQGLWANRKFFWSEKMTACVVNALRSTSNFQTVEEADHQHECDEWDSFRKNEDERHARVGEPDDLLNDDGMSELSSK